MTPSKPVPDVTLRPGDALLVADIQNDFLPGGSLGIKGGDEVVPVLLRYIAKFHAQSLPIFASRDWHPPHHCSFREQGGQWPVHCVIGSPGAQPPPHFSLPPSTLIIHKATCLDKDAYSVFEGTALETSLRAAGVRRARCWRGRRRCLAGRPRARHKPRTRNVLPAPSGPPVDAAPIYQAAMREARPALARHFADTFTKHNIDALLAPTTPAVAVTQGPEASSLQTFLRFIRNTVPGSNAGLPGLSIPAGLGPSTGMPVGLSLDGLRDSDERLLAIGMAIGAVIGIPAAIVAVYRRYRGVF